MTTGRIALFALLVADDDAAIRFFTQALRFAEAPRHELHGTVAVFEDLCGNRWDLIEPRQPV